MFTKKVFFFFICVLMLGVCPMSVKAQQNLKFDIVKFELNQLDGTASNKDYEKIDGSGNRYAIIKVRSTDGDEGLGEFMFNFNSLKSIVEDKGDELWVYVQKNAKMVTISREGYTPLRNFDLKMTLQEGKTYNMEITYDRVEKIVKKELRMQMVSFRLTPAVEGALVVYKKQGDDKFEKLGITDKNGEVSINLNFGAYEYQVMADNYFTTEGIIKLNDSDEVYTENMTLQVGKTYNMEITNDRVEKVVKKELRMQMLSFKLAPAVEGALVVYKKQGDDKFEKLGITDKNGEASIKLNFGTYEYQVMADNYFTTEGIIKLNNSDEVYTENISLKPNFSTITLVTNERSDIYVNNELKGRGKWTGALKAGEYVVECKQEGHRPTNQGITVEVNADKSIELQHPIPITGYVSVISVPAGATVLIDGVEKGTTPCNIKNVLTGTRKLTVTKQGYNPVSTEIYVEESKMSKMNFVLDDGLLVSVNSNPSGAQLFIDGEYKQLTPFSANITPGNHLVELKHNGYKIYKKNVLFDKDNPTHYAKLKNSMTNYYFQANCQYGLNESLLTGASIGAYYKNFNAQLDFYFGDETTYIDYSYEESEHSVYYIGLRLGYGMEVTSRIRLTSQLGCGYVNIGEGKYNGYYSYYGGGSYGTLALRVEYGILPWLTVNLTPEYRFPINLNDHTDCFDKIVKDFRINLGVAFGF